MPTSIARVGDTISHGGTIITGSPNWTCEGPPIARVGDSVECTIHGLQTIVTGSPDWTCNGPPIARIGSLCSCGATITSGASRWTVT